MNISTSTTTKLDNFPVEFTPVEWIDEHLEVNGDIAVLRYAALDDYPMEYEWDDEFVTFYQADPRYMSPHTQGEVEAMPNVFMVERYEHGQVAYSLASEVNYPDRRWDVSLVGLIGVSNDMADPRKTAAAVLEEYTSWCNGDVYLMVEETYENVNDSPVQTGIDVCGGFIGTECAEQVVLEGL